MPKKKLLICIEGLAMNGVMTSFKNFIQMLDREKFEIYVFSYTQSGPYWKECIPSDVIVLPEMPHYKIAKECSKEAFAFAFSKGYWLLGLKRLAYSVLSRFSKKVKPSFLHLKGPCIPGEYDIAIGYAPTTLFTIVQDKVCAKKRIIWQHSDYRYCPEEWQFARFDKLDALVCVGKGIEDLTRRDYPVLKDRLFTIHNIVDLSHIVSNAEKPLTLKRLPQVFRLVTVGRFCYQKNQLFICEVAKMLKHRNYHFEWLLVGDDTYEYGQDMHRRCEELDVEDVVKFVGQHQNPHPIVKSADLAVIPSNFEGWGLTVTEAVAIDVPVLVSDIPVFHEQCAPDDIVQLDAGLFADAIAKRFDALLNGQALPCNKDCLRLVSKDFVRFEFEEMLKAISAI